MVSKKQLLLQSIRELLALNVSDREIILNLKEVGIDSQQARTLVEEAKNPAVSTTTEDITSTFLEKTSEWGNGNAQKRRTVEKKAEAEKAQREIATEELAGEKLAEEEKKDSLEEMAAELSEEELGAESKEKEEAVADEEQPQKEEEMAKEEEAAGFSWEEKPREKKLAKAEPRVVEDITVSKLWEKGILGAVNQRLAEMKNLKEDINSVLNRKVAEATKKDVEKIKVLFDSQRALLVSKVDAEIEAKAKSFAGMIELKLREMRGINRQISSQIENLKDERDQSRVEIEKISAKLREADKVKEELVSSLNSEIIKSKTQSKQLLQEMNEKLVEMDARINKTLQLENQVVEGLVKGAEQRIEEMVGGKAGEFEKGMKKLLQEFRKTKDSFDAEQSSRIAAMETQFNSRSLALDNQIKERLTKLDELQQAITVEIKPEKFKEEMKELNEFKVQFVDAIKQNAEKFNEGTKKLNEEIQKIEKQFALRAEMIDKKIAELDAFEKNFSKELGLSLEKMKKKPKKR